MAELPIVDASNDADQLAGHVHTWEVRATDLIDMPRMFLPPQSSTRCLLRCTQCGWPGTVVLAGRWTIEQLA